MPQKSDPPFRPEDLEQFLEETPPPLVIDVEALRICSEKRELIQQEVARIVEKTLRHIQKILPKMPIGRHLELVMLQKLPGSLFIQRAQTPWGEGAQHLYQGIRACLAQRLTKSGIPTELVPIDTEDPEAPLDPSSQLSVDILIQDDEESVMVLAPEGTEMPEDGSYPEGALSIYEKSRFRIYGTKWKK